MARRLYTTFLCALCASLFTASANLAAAQRAELSLRWQAPGACASEGQIRARVAALLGRELSQATDRWLDADAQVTPEGDGYRLLLRTRDSAAQGERSLRAEDCTQLAEATALVLALAIDPERVVAAAPEALELASPAPPPDEPAEQAAQAAQARPPHADAPTVPKPAGPGWKLSLAAAAALDWGDLPEPTPGGRGVLAVTRERLRLSLDGHYWRSRRADAADTSADVSLWALGLHGCARALGGRPTSLWPCLGVEVGRLTGEAAGDLRGRNVRHKLWSAALVSLRGAWQAASWLSLALEAGMSVPFTRPRFVVESADGATSTGLHRPAPLALRLSLGAELTF